MEIRIICDKMKYTLAQSMGQSYRKEIVQSSFTSQYEGSSSVTPQS